MEDPDILDILESGQDGPDGSEAEEGEEIDEDEEPTSLDVLKRLVAKNLGMLSTPGPVDDPPFTLPELRERYPQVSI